MALLRRPQAETAAKDAVVLHLGDLGRQGAAIRAHAASEAARILSEAKAERARIVSGAKEEGHAQGLGEGRTEGLRKGRAEGHQAALEEARQKLAKLEESWSAALEGFLRAREQMLVEARGQVVELAVEIARRVTRRVVECDPTTLGDILGEAVSHATRSSELVIAVHPEDRAGAEEALPRLAKLAQGSAHVRIAEDERVERGGCVVRTERGGEIDASISTQLDRIVRAIVPERRGDGSGEAGEEGAAERKDAA